MSDLAVESSTSHRRSNPSDAREIKGSDLVHAMEAAGIRKAFSRGAEVYGENEKAEYVYKVISGTIRAYKMVFDGRRLIGSFYLPDDVFGLEEGERHLFSSEAIVDSEMLMVRRDVFMSLAAQSRDRARDLWALTAHELQQAQKHMLLLNKSAPERVASFLLEMSQRIEFTNELSLPMSRQDIADYLGLTSETVSRMLSRFEHSSAIVLPTCRRVVLRNRTALKRLLA